MADNYTEITLKLGKIEGAMGGLVSEMSKLSRALFGNGRPGLTDKVTRMEEQMETVIEKLDETAELSRQNAETLAKMQEISLNNAENLKRLSDIVEKLSDQSSAHSSDANLHTPKGLFLRKDVLGVFIATGIVIIAVTLTVHSLGFSLDTLKDLFSLFF